MNGNGGVIVKPEVRSEKKKDEYRNFPDLNVVLDFLEKNKKSETEYNYLLEENPKFFRNKTKERGGEIE